MQNHPKNFIIIIKTITNLYPKMKLFHCKFIGQESSFKQDFNIIGDLTNIF